MIQVKKNLLAGLNEGGRLKSNSWVKAALALERISRVIMTYLTFFFSVPFSFHLTLLQAHAVVLQQHPRTVDPDDFPHRPNWANELGVRDAGRHV